MSSFQERVDDWIIRCFGEEMRGDTKERCYRFFEEATELVQSLNITREDCHELVDYVFNRPVGDPPQEAGGVLVCLAALCTSQQFDMLDLGETELWRIETLIEKIRQKNASKPFRSGPLPGTN